MHQYGFEKLNVWRDSIDLGKLIYKITQDFPTDEKYGLVSQLRRAVISISSNIAEGSGRAGNKNQGQFYQFAYSSTMEVMSQLIISTELGYMSDKNLILCREKIELVTNRLNALRNALDV